MGKKLRAIDPRPPGTTKQDVETPDVFLEAVRNVWGPLEIDLAASRANVCDTYFDESCDSLTLDWADFEIGEKSWMWLNPPFSLSKVFLAKCSQEAAKGARILSLVQSAPGCDYWEKTVWRNPYCQVVWLLGRVPFVGYENGANIDCVVIVWNKRLEDLHPALRILTWDWRIVGKVPKNAWPITLENFSGSRADNRDAEILELKFEVEKLVSDNYEMQKMLGKR